ncbi:ABC transporter ATP-binding protein [Streptobacillus ratti]|uniref:ATP-binding cassette domain-containing protein n=1 Tax=Streptobacillus ratti TaxID=1720557 RepID=UPI000933212F|nr:ABC transporter ATP-binding protein [Streptobacillus ratti]
MKKYIKEEKFKFLLSIVLMLVISIGTIYSIYIRANITNLILEKNYNVYKYIAILVILIILIENLGTLLKLNNADLIKKWKLKLGNNISENISKMGYDKYKEKTVGSYISWYTGDLPLISAYIFENSIAILNHVTLSLVSLLLMFYISIYIGILALILLFALYLIGGIFGKKISAAYQRYAILNGKFNNILQDFLIGYDLLKNYNNLTFLKKNITYGQSELEHQHYIIKKVSAYGNLVSQGTKKLLETIMFIITGYLVLNNRLTIGMLVVTPTILSVFLSSTMDIFDVVLQYLGTKDLFKKLNNISETSTYKYPILNEKINLENISFKYDEVNIIKNLSLTFEKNKKYAIIGESGSGKSTLLKLIIGRLKENEGQILIDDKMIKNGDIDFSNQIAYVSQDNYMFNLSVKDNISLNDSYTDNEINEILKEVKIYDVISSKKDGLNTNINEFSGGEKQRISLARALIRNTPIIILDEATSALDKNTTIEIENILLSKKDKTIILISHHLSEDTKEKFDNVYLL